VGGRVRGVCVVKWWDREKRIRGLSAQLREATFASKLWYRQYVGATKARAEVAARLLFAEREAGRAGRYRLAWQSARRRAGRLDRDLWASKRSVDYWQARHDEGVKARRRLVDDREEQIRVLSAELDRRLVPMPAAPGPPGGRDRENALRLAAENADLRAQVEDLKRKYEGNPS
jgi:hypothetical protein